MPINVHVLLGNADFITVQCPYDQDRLTYMFVCFVMLKIHYTRFSAVHVTSPTCCGLVSDMAKYLELDMSTV